MPDPNSVSFNPQIQISVNLHPPTISPTTTTDIVNYETTVDASIQLTGIPNQSFDTVLASATEYCQNSLAPLLTKIEPTT